MVIKCWTGDDVQSTGDSLIGADLRNLNLHRADLFGRNKE